MRTPPERPANQQFSNADSYGMAFDEAWERIGSLDPADSGAREAALQGVISALSDHPFALSQPELVRQVAEFRLRLLQR
ncbi:hypothetical protein KBZ18_15705 [Synechococcus sp. Cruz-9H2]|uniref:hypothetical protein n=1 Tax=unclassified Synechococcus TaxID=2626047 RepID=UPI0020CEAEAE|nr:MULTISPECIES: hypothetical protein [unclassified Synechococcus]MCP9820928.1 hypothetical protein [Synechococcus sp. Cruz-9H2]MCP9845163.1 hypothetical protein [Synechococcus sp. Edmonson 11F2]MCP9857354.1 hypothetical protein [Synechococcus sp. Cruz-9C9]MCP9864599.1 hypothetical protein [Synechococcus sp. Cruz-7E5]MCP9871869.1 hypothetical protein [Synechococcus sp. Cruz-7B9]